MIARIGGDNVLLFVFFIGVVIVLFIKPIIGFGVGAIGSDAVDAVYSRYKYNKDVNSAVRRRSINRDVDRM